MSFPSTQPRILFVTPEAAFIPEGTEYRPNYISVDRQNRLERTFQVKVLLPYGKYRINIYWPFNNSAYSSEPNIFIAFTISSSFANLCLALPSS